MQRAGGGPARENAAKSRRQHVADRGQQPQFMLAQSAVACRRNNVAAAPFDFQAAVGLMMELQHRLRFAGADQLQPMIRKEMADTALQKIAVERMDHIERRGLASIPFPFTQRPQIDSQLLAFLVEMAALQSQRPRGLGHVLVRGVSARPAALRARSSPRARSASRWWWSRRSIPSQAALCGRASRTSPTCTSSPASSSRRSTTLRSSRTLPGQGYRSSSAMLPR